MSGWGLFGAFVAIVVGCLVLTWLTHAVDQTIRRGYAASNVAYDDAELAAQVAEDERAWAEWAAICQVLDIAPDQGTPIYDRLVCDEMERAEGWAS